MNLEVKQLWIEKLPTYKKGNCQLHPTYDTFDVLGVLCDLYRIHVGKGYWLGKYFIVHEHANDKNVPLEVLDWADLVYTDFYVDIGLSGKVHITLLNDTSISFEELSNIIKEQL